jgi:microcystin-dependent protein
MARKRVDSAPQFNVGDESVLIQQAPGSTAPLLDIKDSTGSSLMTVASTGAMTTSAPMTSPELSGTPTAPTAAAGTSTTQIATTAFVTTADNLKANIDSPTFTGVPLAPTAAAATNTTQIATTAFVRTEVSNLVASAPAALDTLDELAAALGDDANFATTTATAIGLKAPIDSPVFTGTPTAPTASTELSNTQLATTEFVKQIAALFTPSGSVISYAGASAPTGWLLCSGQTVSRTTYSSLFAAIGTTYGVGDGSTTFTLPDMRGRVVAGVDNMGGSAASRLTNTVLSVSNAIGAVGGAETHTLTSAQSGVPGHAHGNTLTGTTSFATSNHTHRHVAPIGLNSGNIFVLNAGSGQLDAAGNYSIFDIQTTTGAFVGTGGSAAYERYFVTSETPSATASVGLSNATNTAANASQAHLNTQPTIVLNYIIKV